MEETVFLDKMAIESLYAQSTVIILAFNIWSQPSIQVYFAHTDKTKQPQTAHHIGLKKIQRNSQNFAFLGSSFLIK